MSMSRQEKRAELRKVAKGAAKVRKGTATIGELQSLNKGIQRLQEVGVLPPSKKQPVHRRVGNFFKKLFGGSVGYVRS